MHENPQATIHIDHIVLTSQQIEISKVFYRDILQFRITELSDGRVEAHFGLSKINLQPAGKHYGPPNSPKRSWNGNVCILTAQPIEEIIERLEHFNVEIEDGPVKKIGALGPINSIYFRDPDGNLIELSNQISVK